MNRPNSRAATHRAIHPDQRDYYPTPLWVARAFAEVYLPRGARVWEPACGCGAMARALTDCGASVIASDIEKRGFGDQANFLTAQSTPARIGWIITNPPFVLADEFCQHALRLREKAAPDISIAMLCRLQFVESKGRYALFTNNKPLIHFFAGRINFWRGELRPENKTSQGHAWFIWRAGDDKGGVEWFDWDTQARHTRAGDYPNQADNAPLPLA